MQLRKIQHSFLKQFKMLNGINDRNTIAKIENDLACGFAGPLVFTGAFLNYLLFYGQLHHKLQPVVLNSLFLWILGTTMLAMPFLDFDVRRKTHVVSIQFSLLLVFLTLEYYPYMGTSILMLAFIEFTIALIRISRVMAYYVSATTFGIGLYVYLFMKKVPYRNGDLYYILVFTFFLLLLLCGLLVHKINESRYQKISNQFENEVHQREEIEGMYEEIAATEEELRSQYDQLSENNRQLLLNEERLDYLVHNDVLTELPNRKRINEQINELIRRSSLQKDPLCFYVVFIDLDNFKKINDTMGHHTGDVFIREAAIRLSGSIHEGDMVGRIGGDEFALIVQRPLMEEEAHCYIEKIRKDFNLPFLIGNSELRSSASFGVAAFPKDGSRDDELMKNADTAMYKAKEAGKNRIQFFKSSMMDEMLNKITLENRLVEALRNNEFHLAFQPIFFTETGKVRGFETLVRWNSPELGIVSPLRLIQAAEEIGMIIPLGEWIFNEACKRFKLFQDKYQIDAVLSINVSVIQLEDEQFIDRVKDILKETGLDPRYVELEITESVFIDSFLETARILKKLKDMNIGISLDDFGTGYSSLSYLRQLPIDLLKIDRSFINDLLKPEEQKQIIGNIISLAHNLQISVVAEGIEEEVQRDYLKNLDCNFLQGFLLGKPIDDLNIEQYIVSNLDGFHLLQQNNPS